MDTDIIPPKRPPISSTSTPEPQPQFFQPAKEKSKSAPISLLIILTIIAILGVGFGIYGIFFQTPVVEEKITTVTEECKPPSTNSELENTEFYFYLGELGLKIAIPEEYKGKISYFYDESGIAYIFGHSSETRPDFSKPFAADSTPLFAISSSQSSFSTEKFSFYEGEEVFTTTNNKTFYYHGTDFSSLSNRSELESTEPDLKSFFVDKYKYSNL